MAAKKIKKSTLFFRVSNEERALIQSKANKLGHTVSSYVRFIIATELAKSQSLKQN